LIFIQIDAYTTRVKIEKSVEVDAKHHILLQAFWLTQYTVIVVKNCRKITARSPLSIKQKPI